MADVKHFHFYMNNPTAGSKDGTKISEGDKSLPLTFTLNATESETKIAKCAIRCDEGYIAGSDTTISLTGTNASKWKLANDDDYANVTIASAMCNWQDSITIDNLGSTNQIFWVKASSSDETPANDSSVTLQAEAEINAEE